MAKFPAVVQQVDTLKKSSDIVSDASRTQEMDLSSFEQIEEMLAYETHRNGTWPYLREPESTRLAEPTFTEIPRGNGPAIAPKVSLPPSSHTFATVNGSQNAPLRNFSGFTSAFAFSSGSAQSSPSSALSLQRAPSTGFESDSSPGTKSPDPVTALSSRSITSIPVEEARMEAQSGKVEDGKGNGVQLKVCITAKNLSQDENGGYMVVAGRQGQQTDVEITVVGNPTGVALENNLLLEALLLGPDNMPVRHAKMKGYIAPALEQWTGASNRPSSDPNTRTTVSLPAQTPTPFTRTVSLKFLVLSGQVHGPLRLCLRPSNPSFAALQVILPPMTCVARAKTDTSTAVRGSKRIREGESPQTTNTADSSETADGGPAKGKVVRPYSDCSVLAVIPPIGPSTPSRASVLVRVTSLTIPFDLWLSKGYSLRLRADPEGDVTVYNGMAERLFRLPPLDIQKYSVHVQCGQGGLVPSALKYAVCSVAIEKPDNHAVIASNHVRFVFSVEPISCFEGKGFRLYLQDGRVIDTECKRTVFFDRLGPHFAVVEIIDEVYGSANFNNDTDDKATIPRIRAVYELSDGEQRVVVLTDGRCFCTNVDLTGVQTELDSRTRGPCPPVQSPCYYGIRSSRVNFTLVSSVEQKERMASTVRAGGQQDDLLRQVGITQNQLAQILHLLSRPGMSLSLGGGGGGGGGSTSSGSTNDSSNTTTATHTVEHERAQQGACQIIENLVHSIVNARDSVLELIDMQDEMGNSILMQASALGSADSVTALLRAGADMYIRNNDGDLALHMAARQRSVAVLDVFYSLGWDFLLKGNRGHTVVDIFPEYWSVGRAWRDSRPRMMWRPPIEEKQDDECDEEEEEKEEEEEEGERTGTDHSDQLPDDILVRIFSYVDTFELCPIRLTCRRFRDLAHQSNTTLDTQRLDAIAQRLYKVRGNPLIAYSVVRHEILGQRVSHALWGEFVAAVSRAAVLEKESTQDELMDPEGDAVVMSHTPEMVATCQNIWHRLTLGGRNTVEWNAIANAMYDMFAPIPISQVDIENAYEVIRGAVSRICPSVALPTIESLHAHPFDWSSFVVLFCWYFFAKRTFVGAQDMWVKDSTTTMPFLSRDAVDALLLSKGDIGSYVLRVSSYLWPDSNVGALAMSTCVQEEEGTQPAVRHELLSSKKEYSASAILDYIRTECPEARSLLPCPPSLVPLLGRASSCHPLLGCAPSCGTPITVHSMLPPPIAIATTRTVERMLSSVTLSSTKNALSTDSSKQQTMVSSSISNSNPTSRGGGGGFLEGEGGSVEDKDQVTCQVVVHSKGPDVVPPPSNERCGRYFAKKKTSSLGSLSSKP